MMPSHISSIRFISNILNKKRTAVFATRLYNLKQWCEFHGDSDASFVECGVGKGGCIAFMAFMSNGNKTVWGFDSFEGMPELSEEDENNGSSWVGYCCSGDEKEQAVPNTFELLETPMDNVKVVKGFFEDTLEDNKNNIGPISILRLDNDWYKSTYYCLETLYDQVIDGGIIILDDYGQAVDQFREERKISQPLIMTDTDEYYWQKS